MSREEDPKLIEFYNKAYDFSLKNYKNELGWIEQLKPENITDCKFLSEYIWVVLCSGFKVSLAGKISDKLKENSDLNVIKHPLKRKAIGIAYDNYKNWFKHLKSLKTDEQKLEFLDSLPHIGAITKYHLAKNIGLNFAKPDVHLTRLAQSFGYEDVQVFCEIAGKKLGHRKNVVDQVLWRYCEQNSNYLEELKIK